MPARRRADGRRRGPVAVIDIGSNSLRLVVYDGLSRAPRMLFNEKVLCGLGRDLGETGRLHPDGVKQATENLRRFVSLARAVPVSRLHVLATAAVRDADDGAEFIRKLERSLRIRASVLSGPEEGRLSAYGVIASIPEAHGLMGDLGGGSVELVPIAGGQVGPAASLPIGPLRLAAIADDERRLRDTIDRHLDELPWLDGRSFNAFYAVGGAWRALARIHMQQSGYPLHVIQQYTLSRGAAEDFLELVAHQSRKSLEKIPAVSRKRLETVPFAARVLYRLVKRTQPKRLIFSAYGLREGHLYTLLDEKEQQQDPLLAGAIAMAQSHRRFGADGDELFAWTQPLYPNEDAEHRRLRHAAALLTDVAWAEHPDYRAEQALRMTLFMPLPGLDHRERAFLAAALHARYGGADPGDAVRRLLDDERYADARRVGLALRLGNTLTGGVPGLLAGSKLGLENGTLTLSLGRKSGQRLGESVQRRLDALGRALGKKTEIRV
ncbi:MAG TPA: Ppx/GppA family phosphatase [Stellaceae bacterium]|jgi:exopolyphosphatase/guanosine-5'-triphosphate,3'-diphosphate pyrophosphatase|nr:Ppx/GppA family phosphatase [Stellaceae bacterium]